MLRNSFILVILAGLSVVFFQLFLDFSGNEKLNSLAQYYAQPGNIEAVNAVNLVSAVVVTYRGLDTLGEVTILFLTAAIIGFFLKGRLSNQTEHKFRKSGDILITSSQILVPVMILFGIYVIINGHLTPGGGFQGGAIIASAVVLAMLADPTMKFNHKLFTILESISGLSFVLIGVAGMILAGGFLDNRIISVGKFGNLISAGAIPLLYIFIGLKVGSELSNILGSLKETQGSRITESGQGSD